MRFVGGEPCYILCPLVEGFKVSKHPLFSQRAESLVCSSLYIKVCLHQFFILVDVLHCDKASDTSIVSKLLEESFPLTAVWVKSTFVVSSPKRYGLGKVGSKLWQVVGKCKLGPFLDVVISQRRVEVSVDITIYKIRVPGCLA